MELTEEDEWPVIVGPVIVGVHVLIVDSVSNVVVEMEFSTEVNEETISVVTEPGVDVRACWPVDVVAVVFKLRLI